MEASWTTFRQQLLNNSYCSDEFDQNEEITEARLAVVAAICSLKKAIDAYNTIRLGTTPIIEELDKCLCNYVRKYKRSRDPRQRRRIVSRTLESERQVQVVPFATYYGIPSAMISYPSSVTSSTNEDTASISQEDVAHDELDYIFPGTSATSPILLE